MICLHISFTRICITIHSSGGFSDREDIQLRIIGDVSGLPKSLQAVVRKAEEMTRGNAQLDVLVAVNYSGRNDIVQACQKIAHKVKEGMFEPSDINASMIEEELATSCTLHSHPDLFIRTSGEQRMSNFLLWQLAYTELFFSPTFWPDFGEEKFAEALRHFQYRQRRFGGRFRES